MPQAGHIDAASKLIIGGCLVQRYDNAGNTAGHLAARNGHAEVLDKLLLAGYEPDIGTTPPGMLNHGNCPVVVTAAES